SKCRPRYLPALTRSLNETPMSAFCTKRTFRNWGPMSAFGSKADVVHRSLMPSLAGCDRLTHRHLHLYDFPKNACSPVSRRRRRGNKPMTAHLQLVQPNNLNRSVRTRRRTPTRPSNSELRPREYLTPSEVETLIRTARKGRYGP